MKTLGYVREDNHKSVGLHLYEISRTSKTIETEKVDWTKGKGRVNAKIYKVSF